MVGKAGALLHKNSPFRVALCFIYKIPATVNVRQSRAINGDPAHESINLFSDDARRDPYPLYDQIRNTSPVLQDPVSGHWMILNYDDVKRALTDHETFSSKYGPRWMIFIDPPRAYQAARPSSPRAFTPRSIVNLEPRIRAITRELLDQPIKRGEMDLAAELAIPLPMRVIAEMLGIPPADLTRFKRWVDVMLDMSHAIAGSSQSAGANSKFAAATAEMAAYLRQLLDLRRHNPTDDLLGRLQQAELDGERLNEAEILGFFQLLLLAGSETTTNLINNAILCLMENPGPIRPPALEHGPASLRHRGSPALSLAVAMDVSRYDPRRMSSSQPKRFPPGCWSCSNDGRCQP